MEAHERELLGELTALADDLLNEAAAIRQQWSELGEALGVEAPTPDAIAAQAQAQTQAAQLEPAQTAAAEPTPADAAQTQDDSVRLVALDMMLSGRTRADIEAYLHQTFGDGYNSDVLDQVFNEYR